MPEKLGVYLKGPQRVESQGQQTFLRTSLFQGATLWVDQACADCPGVLLRAAGDAPPPELHPGASESVPELAFVVMALRANSWICCPPTPLPPMQKRDEQHKFLRHKGAHTELFRLGAFQLCLAQRHYPSAYRSST